MAINHLTEQRTRPARVDSMDADRMNSIVERLSGVNPSKLAAEVTGEKVSSAPSPPPQAPAVPYGAGPAFDLMGHSQPGMQQLHERIAMLEQRLAAYEDGDPGTAERSAFGHGTIPTAKARKMAQKAAKQNANAKRPANGKADPMKPLPGASAPQPAAEPEPQNAAAEERMSRNEMNVLGIEMSEWKRLAGIEDSYAHVASVEPAAGSLMESDESYDDEYVEVDEMEDEYVESQQMDEMWTAFLEDRGLSVPMFNYLIDEAIRSNDPDEMDALLAVEDVFLNEVSALGMKLRQMKQVTPETMKGIVAKSRAKEQQGTVASGGASRPEETPQAKTKRAMAALQSLKTDDIDFDEDGFSVDEDGGLSFECDSDDKGNPDTRMLRKYLGKKGSKEEMGFGGMSRRGF